MRVTGRGIWGPPKDRAEALATLKRVPELGVNFVDTAWSYGPKISEELIREALHPYDGLLIATKGGLTRGGPDDWRQDGRPEKLISDAKDSLKRLGLEQIALWQLHRIDSKVPSDEQFGAVKQLLDAGLIAHAGLSEVSVAQIEAARKVFPVATVQNIYNVGNRQNEDVLNYCEAHQIGFIPWYPLAAGGLTRLWSMVAAVARAKGAARGQIALAWLLKRSPVMLPIPGTGKVKHLEENTLAAAIELTDAEFDALDKAGR
ncbi:MAG: aldo/keto reductase [Proteobacteria bacterium]|nr:aldo/keto reductase [Pseudomonadota bacterium]